MKHLISLALAILVATMTSSGAALAMDRIGSFVIFDPVPDAIMFDGVIDGATMADFRRALAARPDAEVIILRSPGGRVDVALKFAAELQRRGLSTAIPADFYCYSSCAYVFFAGREHVAKGALGVHQIRSVSDGDASGAATYWEEVRTEIERYGIPEGVIARMADTPSSGMYVFSRQEIAALSINRSDGPSSRVAQVASQ